MVVSIETRAMAELELRRRRREKPPLWTPYPGGPQSAAYHSRAHIVGFGGSAGGGKTDLAIGLALTSHHRSIVFRREYPQLRGIVERSREIVDTHGKYNAQDKIWRLDDGRILEFGACQYPEDVRKYRGRPHDLLVIDEAAEFPEAVPRFLLGWLRTTEQGQRCRALFTFNPPSNDEGQWVVRFFAPWLDDSHPNPAMPGELRWFAMVDGKEVERPDERPFEHSGETITPQSRTFFPARLKDNPILAATGYGTQLQALPEPLRSQLLNGDFKAGIREDAWQLIPTAWIKAAIARRRARPDPPGPMTIMGMDVAHGGDDQTVLARRHDDWFDALLAYPGIQTPDGKSAAALAVKAVGKDTPINVDAIGYGASAAEKLADPPPDGHGLTAHPVNVAEKSRFRDKSGKYAMMNKRAEMYWRLREALDPDNGGTLRLPDDPELLADLTKPRYEITTAGIKVEAKKDIKARIGRSPDRGDAVALAMLPGGPSAGFSSAGPPRPGLHDRVR